MHIELPLYLPFSLPEIKREILSFKLEINKSSPGEERRSPHQSVSRPIKEDLKRWGEGGWRGEGGASADSIPFRMEATQLYKRGNKYLLSLSSLECEQMAVGEKRYALSLQPTNFHYSEGGDFSGTEQKPVWMVFQYWS